ncbi:MAG: DNA polymerase III subunit delta' [Rhodobacteraceae bacterium]|nr:DNA polymerase III subunit delta' [Paracoccaceae bacterium]
MTNLVLASDQVPGIPHPRETSGLFGQDLAEQAFLNVYASGRLHHGWLLCGPQGIGKAVLAWRIARFLLATPPGAADGLFGAPTPPQSLDIDPDHPVARRILAGAEPGLTSVQRSRNDQGRLRSDIVVDDIRALGRFFGLTSADGGRRVVIIDSADALNTSAANALLKMLEEPPARTTLLLIAHQPARLLPTIRSRCRVLRLACLGPGDMTAALAQAGADVPPGAAMDHLAALAGGSVGMALRVLALDGLTLYQDLTSVVGTLPGLARPPVLALAELVAARTAAPRFELLLTLTETLLARLARTGATGIPPVPEASTAMLTRLAPNPVAGRAWADLALRISARTRHGQAVNLDPTALVLDTVFKIRETAQSHAI